MSASATGATTSSTGRALPAALFDAGLGVSALGWAAMGLLGELGPPLPARAVAAALNATVGVLFLARAPAAAPPTLGAIARALPSALVAGVAWRFAPQAEWPAVALGVFAAGGALTVVSLAALGRSFSVFPAARALVARGPYRLVRHPAYLGEIVLVLGIGLADGAVRGLPLASIAALLCVPRILAEEALLAQVPAYFAYRDRVRARLLPGVW